MSLSFFPPSSVNACFSFSVFCHRYACFLCFHVGSLILFSEYVLACMPHVALVWTLLKFFSCFWFPDFIIWTSPFCSFPACLCVFHLQTYRMLVMKTVTYISYILLFDTKLGWEMHDCDTEKKPFWYDRGRGKEAVHQILLCLIKTEEKNEAHCRGDDGWIERDVWLVCSVCVLRWWAKKKQKSCNIQTCWEKESNRQVNPAGVGGLWRLMCVSVCVHQMGCVEVNWIALSLRCVFVCLQCPLNALICAARVLCLWIGFWLA